MTDLRAAARQALEFLDAEFGWSPGEAPRIDDLRTALAQQAPLKRATGWAAPKDRYTTPVLFNPYTGEPRDVRDVQSDPQGILIVPPGAVQLAAKKEQHD
jgi:hypothetical protein